MEAEFGLKELEQVIIKTHEPISINGYNFEKFETVAAFDKIRVGSFNEDKTLLVAHGGFDDRAHVWWESTQDVRVYMSQGIFSETQLSLMTNNRVFNDVSNPLYINNRVEKESDENGVISFSHNVFTPLFVYNEKTGERISNVACLGGSMLKIATPYTNVIVDYFQKYDNGTSKMIVGQQLSNGTFIMTGKTKVKDDITGHVRTGILTIPKLKLLSSLSIRLGEATSPMVERLEGIACPVGPRGNTQVMTLDILGEDIYSDIGD